MWEGSLRGQGQAACLSRQPTARPPEPALTGSHKGDREGVGRHLWCRAGGEQTTSGHGSTAAPRQCRPPRPAGGAGPPLAVTVRAVWRDGGPSPTVPLDMHSGCGLSLQLSGVLSRRRAAVELLVELPSSLHTKPVPSSAQSWRTTFGGQGGPGRSARAHGARLAGLCPAATRGRLHAPQPLAPGPCALPAGRAITLFDLVPAWLPVPHPLAARGPALDPGPGTCVFAP